VKKKIAAFLATISLAALAALGAATSNNHSRSQAAFSRVDPPISQWDLNMDGCVNGDDTAILVEAFGSAEKDPNYNPACDFNHDGLVNSMDFNLYRRHVGEGCAPTPTPAPTEQP
jgi:hypothetical protein